MFQIIEAIYFNDNEELVWEVTQRHTFVIDKYNYVYFVTKL